MADKNFPAMNAESKKRILLFLSNKISSSSLSDEELLSTYAILDKHFNHSEFLSKESVDTVLK